MFEFKLPDLGEGIHEGQVVNVLVKEGDTLAEYQPMLEVETDKAAVEIPSPKAGVVTKIHVKAGQTVKVGEVMIEIDDSRGGNGEPRRAPRAEAAAPAPAETPPAPASAPAAAPRPVFAAEAPAAAEEAERPPAPAAAPAPQPPEARAPRTGPTPAAPAVRKLAREMGIDIAQVPPSGPGGRVLRDDVLAFAHGERRPAAAPAEAGAEGAPPAAEPLPDFAQYGPIRREPVPQIRKTIARQMARAWSNVPRVTHADEADITELERHRKQFNEQLREGEAKLTTTAIMLKLVGMALRHHARVNASYDPQAAEIVYKDYIHIGLAVDTPRGLVVPVIRDVDRKPLPALAAELTKLAQRTRQAQFEIAELRGASFTITNYGALGGVFGTPMVNYPESAILGMGRARWRPWVHEGQIVPRLILPLSLSFDHRIVDGADAARFMNDLLAALENPLRLLSLG